MKNSMILMYVTHSDYNAASKLAHHLINSHLIACANIFPIKSIYKFKEKINEDNEVILILKTTKENEALTRKEIEKQHKYEVPCILTFEVSANESFFNFVKNEVIK